MTATDSALFHEGVFERSITRMLRRMHYARRPLLLLSLFVLVGCTSDEAANEEIQPLPDPLQCDGSFEANSYQPGEKMFREVTQAWGLDGVEAVRVSVLDVDGDGFADLLLRNGGGPDDFGAEGKRARYLLRNQGDRFVDITQQSGLLQPRYPSNMTRNAEVVCSADVDNDGDVDVYMAAGTPTSPPAETETSELLLNDGSGNFSLGPATSAARGEFMGAAPRGCSFGDMDRNGLVDIFVAHNTVGDLPPLQDRLYLGDGTGGFIDATAIVGLTTETWFPVDANKLNQSLGHSWGWGTAVCDLNNDGFPELLAASYGRAPNQLWQASPDAQTRIRYSNRSVASGYAYDQRSDWTNNINAQCYCAENPQAEDCGTAPPAPDWIDCAALKEAFGGGYRWQHNLDREAWRLGGNSATTTCADINNDGFLDLVTGEIVHWDVGANSDPAEVALNSGESDVRFERPGNEVLGLLRERTSKIYDDGDMNNAVFDFDNDGLLDIYISSSDYPGTRGWLFHQQTDGTFFRVPLEDGVDHLRSAGAIAVDIDRDGDLDLVVGHSRFRCSDSSTDCYATQKVRIFENLSNQRNHWLQVRLEGVSSNRSAIGARVVVEACDRQQTRHVDGGHGHMGAQEDKVLHFGLGAQKRAKVTVHWPDDVLPVESFVLESDAVYHLRQGQVPGKLSLQNEVGAKKQSP